MSDPPARFTDRLLEELLPLVGNPKQAMPPPRSRTDFELTRRVTRSGPARRLAVLASALLLTFGGAVLVAALWPQQLVAAYAVEPQADGTVLVTVNDLSDPTGLQNLLTSDKVPATVLVVQADEPCTEQAHTVPAPGAIVGQPGQANVVLIRPAALPPGSRAVLGLTQQAGAVLTLFTVVDGPAPSCFPGSAPVPKPT
jgi:hypothetical protein